MVHFDSTFPSNYKMDVKAKKRTNIEKFYLSSNTIILRLRFGIFCSRVSAILLLLAFHPTRSLDLQLQHLSHCAFHLVHFYDLKVSEWILQQNQYGQPWTVHNLSEPMSRSMLDDFFFHNPVLLPDWESRFYNVHILAQPNHKHPSFGSYFSMISVRNRDRVRTFVIAVEI